MGNTTKAIKNIFKEGAIPPEFIAESIAKHQHKHQIGAHDIFMGQVRGDQIDGKRVIAIDYTAHEQMANEIMHEIRENCFSKFELSCMHVYHSLGKVETGEICLFVFASSPHRKEVFSAIEYLVEEIKEKLPIFGKEILEDETHVWKENR